MHLLAVNYHYYRLEAPKPGIHPISPSRFAAQISGLATKWTIAKEAQVEDAIGEGRSGNAAALCLITFDDGLKEQMRAVRWLMRQNLSAMCYVPTAPVVERRVLDVHKLHIVRTLRSDAALAISLSNKFGPLFSATDRDIAARQYPYDNDDARQVKYFLNFVVANEARREWLNRLFRELVGSEAEVADALYMDREDIRELARHGMLGTHGHSHAPLATLSASGVRQEIARSLDILEGITGIRVRGIAYPYGGSSAANETVGGIAAELGLVYGLTMRAGVNGTAELANAMLLSRIDTNDVPAFLTPPERLDA
jgi:peptidoglycan/xylan/chitin deacetylase (PgdA/CDA1 family)